MKFAHFTQLIGEIRFFSWSWDEIRFFMRSLEEIRIFARSFVEINVLCAVLCRNLHFLRGPSLKFEIFSRSFDETCIFIRSLWRNLYQTVFVFDRNYVFLGSFEHLDVTFFILLKDFEAQYIKLINKIIFKGCNKYICFALLRIKKTKDIQKKRLHNTYITLITFIRWIDYLLFYLFTEWINLFLK